MCDNDIDALIVLREYTVEKKEIVERDDKIIFGTLAWPKNVKTCYFQWKNHQNVPQNYYTLESLYNLLKNVDLPHMEYCNQSMEARIPVVKWPNRKDVLSFLTGETSTSKNIDTNFEPQLPTIIIKLSAGNNFKRKHKSSEDEKENSHLKSKKRAKIDTAETPVEVKEPTKNRKTGHSSKRKSKCLTPSEPKTSTNQNDEIAEEITSKSNTDAPKTDQLSPLKPVDQNNEPKNDEITEEITSKSNTDAPKTDKLSPLKPVYQNSQPVVSPQLAIPDSNMPIIVIPSTLKSIITMFNAKELLGDLTFVSSEEKEAQDSKKKTEVIVQGVKSGVSYKVVGNVTKFKEADWNRVVAVFVFGLSAQFKGWPWTGNPVEIFKKIKPFHIKWEDEKLNRNFLKWQVHIIELSKTNRGLDQVKLQEFWDLLDEK